MRVLEFVPFGLLIGALGQMLAGRGRRGRWVASIGLGALGALLGGLLGQMVLSYRDEGPDGFAASLLGAFFFVVVYQTLIRVLRPVGPVDGGAA